MMNVNKATRLDDDAWVATIAASRNVYAVVLEPVDMESVYEGLIGISDDL